MALNAIEQAHVEAVEATVFVTITGAASELKRSLPSNLRSDMTINAIAAVATAAARAELIKRIKEIS